MNTSEDTGKLILRLALGILILLHGRAQISDRYPRDSCADDAHLRPESLVSLGLDTSAVALQLDTQALGLLWRMNDTRHFSRVGGAARTSRGFLIGGWWIACLIVGLWSRSNSSSLTGFPLAAE